jgi:hypothetical protein
MVRSKVGSGLPARIENDYERGGLDVGAPRTCYARAALGVQMNSLILS